MIKMLTENPKLRFKRQSTESIYELGESEFLTVVGKSYCSANIRIDDEWTLVREPVPVWEAIKALTEGKVVECIADKCSGCDGKCKGCVFPGDRVLSIEMVKTGTWYIGDGK